MKTLTPQFHSWHTTNLIKPAPNRTFSIPIKATLLHLKHPKNNDFSSTKSKTSLIQKPHVLQHAQRFQEVSKNESTTITSWSGGDCSRVLIFGAVSIGVALFLMGIDDQRAMALGPEGPLMEEFWDNMRRYALYVLTVSTGVVYTVFQPILELLKNPISAVLILTIIGGSIYIVSQVLSAMVGVSDFIYDYSY